MEGKTYLNLSFLGIKKEKLALFSKLGGSRFRLKGEDILITKFGVKIKTTSSLKRFNSLLKEAYLGNNKGYYSELEFDGLGYRFINLKNEVLLRIGYSHYIYLVIPRNILVFGFRRNIVIFGNDKNNVKMLVGLLKFLKSRNMYQKKGIFEKGEVFKLKEVKGGKK